MRAVGLDFEERRLRLRSFPEPPAPAQGEVLIALREVGVCGTDRDLAEFKFGYPPPGESFLVLGHEALGQVVATGSGAGQFSPGDWVAPTVRRPCPGCPACRRGRRDLCATMKYTERGIMGAHGYFCDYAVDSANDLVAVPAAISGVAILLEPLSIVEKAAHLAISRHPAEPRRALIAGAGSIGILAALVLSLRGLAVSVFSLEPPGSTRARLVREAGIEYLAGSPEEGAYDIVIEAAGHPGAAARGFHALAVEGVMIVLGASSLDDPAPFSQLIARNQTLIGSVNASPAAWRSAVEDIARFPRPVLESMIRRVSFGDFEESITGPLPDRPKTVHVV